MNVLRKNNAFINKKQRFFVAYLFFETFSIIPILVIETSSDEPPYEMNGKVTPVIGNNPTTTPRFNRVWNISKKHNPNTKYLPNKSLILIAFFIIW